jgi:hypothetical protein
MHQIVNIIGPTFFAVLVGYLFGRLSKANLAPLIDISMYVAVPALAFGSMFTSEIVIGEAIKVWAACLIIMAGTLVAAVVLFAALRQKHSGLYLPIVFTNFINIPLPIIYLAFGEKGAAQALLMYIPQGLIMYSLGVYVASGEKDMKQGLRVMMRTPLIYAAILGLAFNLLRSLPTVVIGSVKLLGQAAVPLMLHIGHEHRPLASPRSLTAPPACCGWERFRFRPARGLAAGDHGRDEVGGVAEAAMPAASCRCWRPEYRTRRNSSPRWCWPPRSWPSWSSRLCFTP